MRYVWLMLNINIMFQNLKKKVTHQKQTSNTNNEQNQRKNTYLMLNKVDVNKNASLFKKINFELGKLSFTII